VSYFTVKASFPVATSRIYEAWLTGKLHTEMTGGEATGKAEEGSKFTAWDGYIFGTVRELIENEGIVLNWRTTEFKEDYEDSLVEISLIPTEMGCEVVLKHSNIPEGDADYESGWHEFYFTPMKAYFG